ncbi:MAG: hypothetical protein KJ578_03705 [Bacteroidetes bacterium]|nr:hypothetical protein [Bacteroidota bacterium]MBU1578066.1 hypothetical protein [Bacteroidota bacterium]MBU2466430.1 hypothetical protein [Bacteroidota bacterium]MBU2556866.1 hypothetical protein [Bacteroidota bacterium]
MKSIKKSLLLFLLLPMLAFAQNNERRQQAMKHIEAVKIGFFTRQLQLTTEEAKRFWPAYEAYQAALTAQKEARRSAIRKAETPLENLSESEINQLIDARLEQAHTALEARTDFVAELRTFLPPLKVVRYFKAEEAFRQKVLERIRDRRDEDSLPLNDRDIP